MTVVFPTIVTILLCSLLIRLVPAAWKGQAILFGVCAIVCVPVLFCMQAKTDLLNYIDMGKVVQSEYAILQEEQKGVLDDTAIIKELQSSFLGNVKRLNTMAIKAKTHSTDIIVRSVYPGLIAEYMQVPDFTVETKVVTEEVSPKAK